MKFLSYKKTNTKIGNTFMRIIKCIILIFAFSLFTSVNNGDKVEAHTCEESPKSSDGLTVWCGNNGSGSAGATGASYVNADNDTLQIDIAQGPIYGVFIGDEVFSFNFEGYYDGIKMEEFIFQNYGTYLTASHISVLVANFEESISFTYSPVDDYPISAKKITVDGNVETVEEIKFTNNSYFSEGTQGAFFVRYGNLDDYLVIVISYQFWSPTITDVTQNGNNVTFTLDGSSVVSSVYYTELGSYGYDFGRFETLDGFLQNEFESVIVDDSKFTIPVGAGNYLHVLIGIELAYDQTYITYFNASSTSLGYVYTEDVGGVTLYSYMFEPSDEDTTTPILTIDAPTNGSISGTGSSTVYNAEINASVRLTYQENVEFSATTGNLKYWWCSSYSSGSCTQFTYDTTLSPITNTSTQIVASITIPKVPAYGTYYLWVVSNITDTEGNYLTSSTAYDEYIGSGRGLIFKFNITGPTLIYSADKTSATQVTFNIVGDCSESEIYYLTSTTSGDSFSHATDYEPTSDGSWIYDHFYSTPISNNTFTITFNSYGKYYIYILTYVSFVQEDLDVELFDSSESTSHLVTYSGSYYLELRTQEFGGFEIAEIQIDSLTITTLNDISNESENITCNYVTDGICNLNTSRGIEVSITTTYPYDSVSMQLIVSNLSNDEDVFGTLMYADSSTYTFKPDIPDFSDLMTNGETYVIRVSFYDDVYLGPSVAKTIIVGYVTYGEDNSSPTDHSFSIVSTNSNAQKYRNITYTNSGVKVTYYISDPSVPNIEFYITDGTTTTLLGKINGTTETLNGNVTYDLSSYADGTYTFYMRAFDNLGNSDERHQNTIVVDKVAPNISLSSSTNQYELTGEAGETINIYYREENPINDITYKYAVGSTQYDSFSSRALNDFTTFTTLPIMNLDTYYLYILTSIYDLAGNIATGGNRIGLYDDSDLISCVVEFIIHNESSAINNDLELITSGTTLTQYGGSAYYQVDSAKWVPNNLIAIINNCSTSTCSIANILSNINSDISHIVSNLYLSSTDLSSSSLFATNNGNMIIPEIWIANSDGTKSQIVDLIILNNTPAISSGNTGASLVVNKGEELGTNLGVAFKSVDGSEVSVDTLITLNGEKVKSIDTNVVGTYIVTQIATDELGRKNRIVKEVTILDTNEVKEEIQEVQMIEEVEELVVVLPQLVTPVTENTKVVEEMKIEVERVEMYIEHKVKFKGYAKKKMIKKMAREQFSFKLFSKYFFKVYDG